MAAQNLQVSGGKAIPTGGTPRLLANIPITTNGAANISVKADTRDNVSGSIMIGLPGVSLGSMDLTNGSLYLDVARNGDYNVRSVTGGVITTIFAGGTIPGWVINSTHTFEFIYHISPKTVDVKMDGAALVSGVSVGTFVPTLQFAAFQGKRLNDTLLFASGDADFDNFVTVVN